jgi:hypothetical protein
LGAIKDAIRFSFNSELTLSVNAPLGFQVLCKMNLYLDNHFPPIMNFLSRYNVKGTKQPTQRKSA